MSTPQDPDLTRLLVAAGDGDREAFTALYDLTSARIYGLALRVLADRSHAEEVAQESYLQCWQQADRFDAGRGTALGWMMTITHRRAVDRVRAEQLHRRRSAEYASADAGVPAAPVGEDIERRAEAVTLRQCLGRLTDLQRSTIELSYFNGMSYPEVAEHTATPLPTIKSRIRDGLRHLRRCVAAGAS